MTFRLTTLALILLTATPAIANDPNWNGDPEPEPPTEEPEPEPQPEPPVVAPEPPAPIRTGSDRDPLPQSRPLPCCIRAGEMVPLWELFATPEGTLRRCEAAIERGNALIYSCEHDHVEALK